MFEFIEVEFKGRRRDAFRNPMEFPFKEGDLVVVEVEKGEHIGKISFLGLRKDQFDDDSIHYNVLRKARPEDLESYEKLPEEEHSAQKICLEKVKKHDLPMKLVETEYQFDRKKLTFYFTADGRVDFRELVKDLAGYFRVRIDLRQIGARDETKRLGGYGVCGMQLCCTTFLSCFSPITTQMAKIQNLSLNPQKLSGCCSRLKCCLKYELDNYIDELSKYPPRESVYKTPVGVGVVEKNDIFKETVLLRYDSGEIERRPLCELKKCECLKVGPQIDLDPMNGDRNRENGQNYCEKPAPLNSSDSKLKVEKSGDIRVNKPTTPFPSDL